MTRKRLKRCSKVQSQKLHQTSFVALRPFSTMVSSPRASPGSLTLQRQLGNSLSDSVETPQLLRERSHILSTVIRHEGHPYVHFNGQVPLTPHWLADSRGSYCKHKQTRCDGKRHFAAKEMSHRGFGSFSTDLLLSNGQTQLFIVLKSDAGSIIAMRCNHLMRWSLCNVIESV